MLAFFLCCAGSLVESASTPFVIRWDASVNQNVTLPFTTTLYNVTIDWGALYASDVILYDNVSGPITYQYQGTGFHNISILADIVGLRFATPFLLEIVSWGDSYIMDDTSTSSFENCVNLQLSPSVSQSSQPVMLPGARLVRMFANTSVNTPFDWDLTNVVSVAHMFRDARLMNQPVTFRNTGGITSTAYMFWRALAFNSPVIFDDTRSVVDMSNMFQAARAFNQSINFDASSLLRCNFMFRDASAFNGAVNLTNASVLQEAWNMFENAVVFNQPILFLSGSVRYLDYMFFNARAFNQPISFNATSLNQTDFMFANALAFNSPVTLTNTANVSTTASMFAGAASFNQPISLDAFNLITTENMFHGASSFNQPVVLTRVRTLIYAGGMFANATSFNQTVNFSSTSTVTNMDDMFLNVAGFEQNLASWDTTYVGSCANFCPRCGLPAFPQCDPCGGSPPKQNGNITVCNCPSSGCAAVNLCGLATVSGDLQVECLTNQTNATTPTPGVRIISPLFNITQDSTNGSTFVFTLPTNPQVVGKITQACYGEALSCEWQDPKSLEFRQSGCAVSNTNVDMGSGVVGTQCTCSHLTVFAIALRSDLRLAPLCQAQDIDYALIALYAALALVLIIQLARIAKHGLSRNSLIQHSLLFLACLLRVAYLAVKPVIPSLAGLVLLGLLPSAIELSLFIHLLLAWASLQVATLKASPFERFRIPFIVVTSLVCTIMALLVVLTGVLPEHQQLDVIQIGSYVLAALYAVVCMLVLASGLGLRRSLGDSNGQDWRSLFRQRLLIATMVLSSCLFAAACLWVAAVQADIIASSAATLASTAIFYIVDWLSLCGTTWLFTKAVKDGVKKSESRFSSQHDNNNSRSSKHSRVTKSDNQLSIA